VVEQMAQGISLGAFAGVIRVSRETVYAWVREHREFSDAVSRARAAQQLAWELKLYRARKGAEVTASIFALKNIAPDQWRDLKQTQHTHTIRAEMLTDAQLNAIAAGQTPADAGVIEGEYERVDP
jgi:predicted transcriptional regulator